jgi:hypothetical protein
MIDCACAVLHAVQLGSVVIAFTALNSKCAWRYMLPVLDCTIEQLHRSVRLSFYTTVIGTATF